MKRIRKTAAIVTLIAACAALPNNSLAETKSLQERQDIALKKIEDAAEFFCPSAPSGGSVSTTEISGNASARIAGLAKGIADLGFGGAAKYESQSYQGPLQKDLVEAIKNSSNCKLDVLRLLKDKFIPDITAPPSVSGQNAQHTSGKDVRKGDVLASFGAYPPTDAHDVKKGDTLASFGGYGPSNVAAAPAQSDSGNVKSDQPPQSTYSTGDINGDGNIVTQNQSGGTNIAINQAPKPKLREGIAQDRLIQQPDGTILIAHFVKVVAPYTARELSVTATAEGILGVELVPQRSEPGPSIGGHSGVREGYAFTSAMNPLGDYAVVVHLQKQTQVTYDYKLD